MRYFKDFIPGLIASNLGVSFYYETKSNLNKTQVRLLRDARISEIQPGIESLSDAVLKLMRKGVSGLQNIQLLKWCKELGVKCDWNFLWGFPGEAAEEYARLAGVVPLLTHLQPPESYATIRLDRFSPNYFDAERMGFTEVQPLAAVPPRLPAAGGGACQPRLLLHLWLPRTARRRRLRAAARSSDRQVETRQEARRRHSPSTPVSIWSWSTFGRRAGLRSSFWAASSVRCIANAMQCGIYGIWGERLPGQGNPASARVERLLTPLVECGLMLRDGGRYLALAIPMGEYVPPRTVCDEFSQLVRKSGEPDRSGWVVPLTWIGNVSGAPGGSRLCRPAVPRSGAVPVARRCRL